MGLGPCGGLADGPVSGIAEEGALAFTEIAMLPGWCFHLLDYRHGPIVVSGGKTLTLVLLRPGEGELQGKMVQDVMARGSLVVTISDQAENLYGAAAHVQITGVDDFAAWGILFIYVAQMTALLKALALGGNPGSAQGAGCIHFSLMGNCPANCWCFSVAEKNTGNVKRQKQDWHMCQFGSSIPQVTSKN